MKFDNIAQNSGIGSNSYRVQAGWTGTTTPYSETVIQHTFIDGSFEMVDIDTKQEKDAELTIFDLSNSEFLALESFFNTYVGERIQIEQEFDGESIFLENFSTGGTYFATVIELGGYEEEDFSETRKTFKLKIKLSEPVTTSTGVFNPDNTGNLNTLIEINTFQVGDEVSTTIPSDLTGFVKGDRWYDTTANKVKEFSGANLLDAVGEDIAYFVTQGRGYIYVSGDDTYFASYVHEVGDKIEIAPVDPSTTDFPAGVYEVAGLEVFTGDLTALRLVELPFNKYAADLEVVPAFNKVVYEPPADDTSIGYVNGVFRWASNFAMDSASYPALSLSGDFISGMINSKSIRIGGQSIDVNKGPSLMTKEGVTFSARNNDRLWKAVVDAGIPLFGAVITIYIYRDDGTDVTLTKKFTGKNLSNTFSYTDYQFKAEPFLLSTKLDLPLTTITDTDERYRNIQDDAVGKAPYLTYGEFDIASLQNISKTRSELPIQRFQPPYLMTHVNATSSDESKLTGAIDDTDGTIIYMNAKTTQTESGDYGWIFSEEQLALINGNGGFTLQIIGDTNSSDSGNINLVRQIVSDGTGLVLDGSGDFYTLTLTSALPVLPTADGGNQLGTAERITFVLTNATYTYQFNEAPSGSFGAIYKDAKYVTGRWGGRTIARSIGNDLYLTNSKRLFYLATNGKDLTEIPPNEFAISLDNNRIDFNLIGVNDPTQAENYSEVQDVGSTNGVTLKPIASSSFTSIFIPVPPNGDVRPIDFRDGSGVRIEPPANYTSTEFQKSLFSFPSRFHHESLDGSTDLDLYGFNGYLTYTYDATFGSNVAENLACLTYSSLEEFKDISSPTLSQRWGFSHGVFANLPSARITAFEYPVSHYSDVDSSVENDSSVALCVNMVIQCIQETTLWTGNEPAAQKFTPLRKNVEGMRLVMRLRMKDNTYRYNSAWEYALDRDTMYVGKETDTTNMGTVNINNMPSEAIGGGDNFAESTSEPTAIWDYDCDGTVADISNRNILLASYPDKVGAGAKFLLVAEKRIDQYVYDAATETFSWDEGVVDLSGAGEIGKILWVRTFVPTTGGSGVVNNSASYSSYLGTWDGTALNLYDSADYPEQPTLSGRELFDVSELFATGTREWEDVEAIQWQFISYDTTTNHNEGSVKGSVFGRSSTTKQDVLFSVTSLDAPKLFKTDVGFNVEDRPMFSAVQGKNVQGKALISGNIVDTDVTFPTPPDAIIWDIMNSLFPNKVSSSSLVSVINQSQRYTWDWRRQFTTAMSASDVMEEIMLNLWAVLRVNEDDVLEFVSLNPDDHSISNSQQVFDDTNILKDSISNPKFRKSDEIFQRFELDYDFNTVSDFTKAVPKWRKTNLMADVPDSAANPELKWNMDSSARLYNLSNVYKGEFKYHYAEDELPMRDWIVKHFVFNAWTIKLTASIDKVLGANALKVMDWVTVQSYFHTGDEAIGGFITKIKPNVYTATCEFTIFMLRPQGYLGPLCDPFKDANVTGRDNTAFTVNDAGTTQRTNGSYAKRDAGTTPRTIEC